MKMKNNFMVHWKNLRKTLIANYKQALQFGAWGAVGGCCGSLIGEVFGIGIRTNISDSFIPLFISVGIWFGIIGVCISIALLLGYSWYLKRGLRIGQSTKEGILPGFIAGFLAGAIAQYTFTTIGPTEFLRVICWGIAGGLLGVGLSFRIPNLGRLRGLAGGTIGGVIGGCLFILFTFLIGVVAGRLLGLAAIGFFIGLAIVLVEAAFREAWLIVHWTPTEQKTISLGTKPVLLGSSEDAHVYLKKSQGYPPMAAKIYTEGEKIIMEFDETMKDKGMKILRHELANGDRRKVGDVMIEVKTATGNLP